MEPIFPIILKKERLKNNLTQEKLAELVNTMLMNDEILVSRVSINRYEKGTRVPNYEILGALSDALDVDLDYLLGKSNLKNVEFPLSEMDSLNETLKRYITEDDKESNVMITNMLDVLNLVFSNCDKKELELVCNLFDLSATAFVELRHNRNIQYVQDGKEDLSLSEREEFKNLLSKDFSKSLDKIDNHYRTFDKPALLKKIFEEKYGEQENKEGE